MQITIKPQGRTGNRLFQYALGVILAVEKNYSLFAPPIPYFDSIPLTNSLETQTLETLHTSIYGDHKYDFNELLKTNKNICIDTYVQKCEHLIEYKTFLQQQFKVSNTLNELPYDNELVIHIRETDYTLLDGYLGNNFYINFVTTNIKKYQKITIVTDNINTELIDNLKDLGCFIFTKKICNDWQNPYFTQNELDDYNYMYHSKHLLLSQSTFSWWAAFLGIPKNIIFPYKKNGGMWKLQPLEDDADLYFDFGQSKKYIIE